MQLSTLVLFSAILASCVLASVTEFINDGEFKIAAFRGIDFFIQELQFYQESIFQSSQAGLAGMDLDKPLHADYIKSLTPEEFEEEMALNRKATEIGLTAIEEITSLVASANASLSPEEYFFLLSLDSKRMMRQYAAMEILEKAERSVEKSGLYLFHGFKLISTRLSATPQLSAGALDSFLLSDKEASEFRSAQDNLNQMLSRKKEEIAILKEKVWLSDLSYREIESILSLAAVFNVKVTDRPEKTEQHQKWLDWSQQTETFTVGGRARFLRLVSFLEVRLRNLLSELSNCPDKDLISFLHSIKFADILLANCPYPEALRECMLLKFSIPSLKKALLFKGRLQDILTSNLNSLNDIFFAKSDSEYCNRYTINLVIQLAKRIGLPQAADISIDQILISS